MTEEVKALDVSSNHAMTTKSAQRDPTLPLVLLGGGIGGIALNALLGHMADKAIRDIPPLRGRHQVWPMLRAAGLPKDMPVFPLPGLDNAFYSSPGRETRDEMFSVLPWKEWLKPGMPERIERLGAIAYDPTHFNVPILAHEVGHARLETNRPWYSPSRINQQWLRSASDFLSPFASAPSAALGLVSKNPLIGAGGGALLGGILGFPTLLNEWQASAFARKYLQGLKQQDPERVAKARRMLRRAFYTYLGGAVAAPALSGLLGGLVSAGGLAGRKLG